MTQRVGSLTDVGEWRQTTPYPSLEEVIVGMDDRVGMEEKGDTNGEGDRGVLLLMGSISKHAGPLWNTPLHFIFPSVFVFIFLLIFVHRYIYISNLWKYILLFQIFYNSDFTILVTIVSKYILNQILEKFK